MSRTLLLSVSPGEAWAGLCDNDELVELRVARSDVAARVGDIMLGRVVGLNPALPAALVEIGLPRPAFLSAEDAVKGRGIAGLTEGEAVVVQVTKDARADKGAGVTLRPRLSSALLDLMPGRDGMTAARGLDDGERRRLVAELAAMAQPGEGFYLRTTASGATTAMLAADAESLRKRWQAILDARARAAPPAPLEPVAGPALALLAALVSPPPARIVIDDRAAYAELRAWLRARHPSLVGQLALHAGAAPLFEHEGMASEIDAALARRVALPCGGAILIETTAAAVTIDVDSGGAPILPANLEAARAAARHIRLRNLAGPIVIDFIATERRGERERVQAALAAALAQDPAEPQLLGWTRLGHFELVRKRRHPALDEMLFERDDDGNRVKTALTVALEALRALARAADATPAQRLALHVAPEVAAALRDGAARVGRLALEARLGGTLALVAERGRARAAFDIAPA